MRLFFLFFERRSLSYSTKWYFSLERMNFSVGSNCMEQRLLPQDIVYGNFMYLVVQAPYYSLLLNLILHFQEIRLVCASWDRRSPLKGRQGLWVQNGIIFIFHNVPFLNFLLKDLWRHRNFYSYEKNDNSKPFDSR